MSFMTLTVIDYSGEQHEIRYNTDFVKVTKIVPLGTDKAYVYWISSLMIGHDGSQFQDDGKVSKYGCDIVAQTPAEVEARYCQATKPPRGYPVQYFTAGGNLQ